MLRLRIDEVFGTTPKEKALGAALVAKEDMDPAEADALDWQTYNKQRLVISRSKDLRSYENRNFAFRTRYDGNQVFATETRGSKTNAPLNRIMFGTMGKYFSNLGQIGVQPQEGTVVRYGQGGGRLPEVSFVPLALRNRPGLQGCNSRNEPWPSAVVTIGVARTLPELVDDSKYYFTDPSSLVNFCLGIKVYCPTQQMVAFLRERDPDGGGAELTWALSFGTAPIGQSSIDALAKEGISQVLGLDSACTGRGIEAFKLLLKKERFFAAFPDDMARELVLHMDKDVEIDFYDVQQWCLGGLNDDTTRGGLQMSKEDAGLAMKGMQEMLMSAANKTGLFASLSNYRPPDPEPEIEIEIPANLKPITWPAYFKGPPPTKEQLDRITRVRYVAKMRDKARKEARAREASSSTASQKEAEATGRDTSNPSADEPSKNTRSKRVKKG